MTLSVDVETSSASLFVDATGCQAGGTPYCTVTLEEDVEPTSKLLQGDGALHPTAWTSAALKDSSVRARQQVPGIQADDAQHDQGNGNGLDHAHAFLKKPVAHNGHQGRAGT